MTIFSKIAPIANASLKFLQVFSKLLDGFLRAAATFHCRSDVFNIIWSCLLRIVDAALLVTQSP